MSCADADVAAGGAPPAPSRDEGYGSCGGARPRGREVVHPAVRMLLDVKHAVLCIWLLAAIAALPFALSVFARLNFEATPLRGSPLALAAAAVQRDFPALAHATPLVVMISCTAPCSTVVDETTFQGLWEIAKLYQELNSTYPGMVTAWDSPSSLAELRQAARFGLSPSGSPRVSEDGQALLSTSLWRLPEEGQDRLMGHIRRLRRLAAELSDPASARGLRPGRLVTVQGMPAMKDAFKQQSEWEFLCKDAFMVPLTLGVFLYQVRSVNLALLVAGCMAACVAIGFGLLTFVADRGLHINTMTPAMMAATCVAMCVDYSLFILTRFREERAQGRGIEAALSTAVIRGGSVVAVSGTILIGCYIACLLFPGDMIFSLAAGNLVMLCLCLLAALTLTPCAIASWPQHFASTAAGVPPPPSSSTWFKLGVWLTRWPVPLVLPALLYAGMAPATWSLASFRTSDDLRGMMPSGSLLDNYEELQSRFPGADAAPILLRLSAGGADGVRSDRFFEDACGLVQQLVNATRGTAYSLHADDFRSVALLPGSVGAALPGGCPDLACLRWSRPPPACPAAPSGQAMLALGSRGSGLGGGAFQAYSGLWQGLTSADASASLLVLQPTFELRGHQRRSLMGLLRSVLPADAVYCRDAVDGDMMEADYSRFPIVMTLSILFMFALISYHFKAAFVPVKLFLTVVVPIFFVFGLLLSIFELGALDRLGIPHLNSDFGLHWSVPILVAPILTGLAVDYDLFLFARVYELRSQGYDDRASVVGALAATGPIINGAGLVMALAFGGMVLSATRLNCEVGFALCTGVLLDTFVVRPLLVPCILMVGGSWNYWPQKMPQATHSVEDLAEPRLAAAPAAALLAP